MADPKALARLPQIRERFKRAMNMKIIADKAGHGFQFKIPGFKYDDFDRAGFPGPVQVNRLLESFLFSKAASLPKSNLSTSYLLLGSHVTYSRSLYDQASIIQPLRLDGRPVRIGRSSLDLSCVLFATPDDNANEETLMPTKSSFLASGQIRLVYIDPTSKRPTPVADEDRSTLLDMIKSGGTYCVEGFPEVKLPADVPHGAFSCEIQPRFSDLDLFFHINQAAYMQYASECAAQASLAGAYPHFSGDICFRHLHTATSFFSDESLATDLLRVSSWEDPSDPCCLCFVIKKGDTLVYRAKFVYYPEEISA